MENLRKLSGGSSCLSEARIQADIVKWLQDQGIYCFSVANEAAGRSAVKQMQLITCGLRAGVSDLVIVLPGRVIFCEVKDDKGKQSERQLLFQKKVESLGHEYILVRSVESLQLYLTNVKNKPIM